jgi:hypothetical protein
VTQCSGLAQFCSFDTHEWLVEAIHDSGPPDFQVQGVVDRLRSRLDKEFCTNRTILQMDAADRRLSVLLSGYRWSNPVTPITAIISNWEEPAKRLKHNQALTRFVPDLRELGKLDCQVIGIGMLDALDNRQVDALRADAPSLTPEAVTSRLVNILRVAGRHVLGQTTIGGQISTVLNSAKRGDAIKSGYHVSSVQRASFVPAFVWALSSGSLMTRGGQSAPVDPSSPPLSVPVVHRNRPCPCGSGKKYKACHGARAR